MAVRSVRIGAGFHAANRAVAILEPIIGNARIEMVDILDQGGKLERKRRRALSTMPAR
jgi:hypothetical protein